MTISERIRAAARSLRRAIRPPAAPPVSPRVEVNFDEWVASRRDATPLYGPIEAAALHRWREQFPEAAARVVEAADAAVAHRFVLLGAGPFEPVDTDRPASASYRPIDWRADPASGCRFPGGFPYKSWNFEAMRPEGADIKLPWELARCQHWVNLGQAWRLTGRAHYVEELHRQFEDFVAVNPVGVGIHWTCTMDVAIRAANWALAWELVEPCDVITGLMRRQWGRALAEHAEFIRHNLENTYEVTSNHYLSNIIGLYFLGELFAGSDPGREWIAFAREAVEQEIRTQVQADGSDFESSVPYHRLVTELFLGAARVAQVRRQPFSPEFYERLRSMVNFIASVLRPDGLMPQLGDADDGRLHVFEGVGRWQPQDPRHLFGPAALVLGDPALLPAGGAAGTAEAVWWGGPVTAPAPQPLAPVDVLHRDAGIAVSRAGDLYLAITNGIVGTKGFGNHKHNDLLSFEFHARGVAWVVDPGSYVYTSNPEARNLFRSTRYHNTLRVDDVEQNEMNPEWLFRLFESAHPVTSEWRPDAERVVFAGSHGGFTRAGGPAHERRFELTRATGQLTISDVLRGGSGDRQLAWHFHLGPGVEAAPEDGRVVLSSGGRECVLSYPPDLRVEEGRGWYSPSYGVRLECATLDFTTSLRLPDEREWRFAFRSRG